MKKAAVLFAHGFEESEALTIVDIIRRAGLVCDMVSTGSLLVEGAHQVVVRADTILGDETKRYDMLVLPGGPGAKALGEDEKALELIKHFDAEGKYIAAICAAPVILAKAGIIRNRRVTVYPGYENQVGSRSLKDDMVVVDENLITGRGPAASYAFAYRLVEALGVDSKAVRERMLYGCAFSA